MIGWFRTEEGTNAVKIGLIVLAIGAIWWFWLRPTAPAAITDSNAGKDFVSIKQARLYFEVHTGTVTSCWPHERMDFTEWELAGKPPEDVWGFVSCRIGSVYKSARAAHVFPGEVLTYGIP